MDNGLGFELKKVISNAFEAIKEINYTRQLISYSNVLDVLTQLAYDPYDNVYILNRLDRSANFWTQRGKLAYINKIESYSQQNNGKLNQTRLQVYDPDRNIDRPVIPEPDILDILEKLHNPGTFFSIPSYVLHRFEKLDELIFGVTISKNHKYAIIPIPSPESFDLKQPVFREIGKTLAQYKDYDVSHGPMKAIITADSRYVQDLIDEFELILKDPEIIRMK